MPVPRDPLEVLGRIAAGLQFSGPGKVFEYLKPWAQRLALAAAPKWIPYLALGQPCHVLEMREGGAVRCGHVACGTCEVCHLSTCLEHSFIASSGEQICYVCVSKQAQAPNGKSAGNGAAGKGAGTGAGTGTGADKVDWTPEQVTAARRVLGVKKSSTWEEIRSAFQAKVKKVHPDQGGTAEEFKKVHDAYELLKKVRENAQKKS